jgi:hypothetical protein
LKEFYRGALISKDLLDQELQLTPLPTSIDTADQNNGECPDRVLWSQGQPYLILGHLNKVFRNSTKTSLRVLLKLTLLFVN